MPFVCRMCGTIWSQAYRKPCGCWWGIRIWVDTNDRFVCARCGTDWPVDEKQCGCWPNGIRVRASEIHGQRLPLPGL